ncbi:DUF397 domain-containing protein [Streptomyces sp. SID3343]|uniref:DUF397 domain-containing protein n=1 Tax=Streptomyces sp. SID3343 TaxID=2690260 RepID=UPI0031F97BB3
MNAYHLTWRKSSYSEQVGECVEVAAPYPYLAVRDSKDTNMGRLDLAPAAWEALLVHFGSCFHERNRRATPLFSG